MLQKQPRSGRLKTRSYFWSTSHVHFGPAEALLHVSFTQEHSSWKTANPGGREGMLVWQASH